MSFSFQEYIELNGRLCEADIKIKAGNMANYYYRDASRSSGYLADVVYETDFNNLNIPTGCVIRMSKKKYVDAFFETGELKLGSFKSYHKNVNKEIEDKFEGDFILVGRKKTTTAFTKVSGGYNNYVFCCTDGAIDENLTRKFGYDSFFVIHNIHGFARAIARSLNLSAYASSKCIYSRDKVIIGEAPENLARNEISQSILQLVNSAKYFVKPLHLKHQNEYRFIWPTNSDVDEDKIIYSKEAAWFCSRG